ncbi:MAG: 4Fe-4S binding domain protein [Syntrophorhabdus sp. PtaU1.Bin050]|jgi:ferredoxin|nr:MAG: 4Fe-4S binding domain protein [Syntrophorhabdus sp. PtaU1.Bin050]
MRIELIKDSCVGCGSCIEICPEVFELDDEVALKHDREEASL